MKKRTFIIHKVLGISVHLSTIGLRPNISAEYHIEKYKKGKLPNIVETFILL